MFSQLIRSRVPFDPGDPDRFLDTTATRADLKGKAVRGGAITAVSQFAKQGLSVLSGIVLAWLLSPSDTGLVAMVTVFVGFMELFNDAGLSAATIQREDLNHKQVSTLFWINILIGTVLALLLIAIAPLIAGLNDQPALVPITLVLSISFIFGSLTTQHQALLRRQMNYAAPALIGIISAAVSLFAAVMAALAGWGYWALVISRLAPLPIDVIGLWYFCPWRPSRLQIAKGVSSLVKFGGNITGFQLLNYAGRNIDNLLIGVYFGEIALGLYAKAYGLLLSPLRRINEPFAAVVVPALSRLQNEPVRYRNAYYDVISKLCLITMPLVAYMVGTSEWFVLILGPQWASAAPMFAWLGVSGLIEPFTWTFGWLFVSQGRAKEQFQWGLVGTTLTIAAILYGVFIDGSAVGVARAYGINGLLLRTPILIWFVGRRGPVSIRDLYTFVAPFALVTINILLALFAMRLWFATDNWILNLLIAAVITAVVTIVTLGVLPSGRAMLLDLRTLPDLLLKRKKIVSSSA